MNHLPWSLRMKPFKEKGEGGGHRQSEDCVVYRGGMEFKSQQKGKKRVGDGRVSFEDSQSQDLQ